MADSSEQFAHRGLLWVSWQLRCRANAGGHCRLQFGAESGLRKEGSAWEQHVRPIRGTVKVREWELDP